MTTDSSHLDIDYSPRSPGMDKVEALCQHLIAKKDFRVVTFVTDSTPWVHGKGFDRDFDYPTMDMYQLLPLADEFDRILVRYDGMTLVAYCIKNGIDAPNKTTIDLEKLRSVGKECLYMTGSVAGTKLPVNIFVIETTNDANDSIKHLKPLKCFPGTKKINVRAFHLNFKTGKVWTNFPLMGILGGRFFFQSAIKAINSGEKVLPPTDMPVPMKQSRPILTIAFIAAFVAIFIATLVTSDTWFAPNNLVLLSFGALFPEMVFNGEHYRLISAAFLHGHWMHLIFNSVAFFMGGVVIETYLGRAWLTILFMVSALGGSLASLFINSPNTLSVGASGGIMGLIAATIFIARRLPLGPEKVEIQIRAVYILIPAVIPLLSFRSGSNIDYAAHIGGVIAGLAMGYVVYKKWDRKTNSFSPGQLTNQLLIPCILAIALSGVFAGKNLPTLLAKFDGIKRIIPKEDIKSLGVLKSDNLKKQEKQLEALIELYPTDPNGYYLKAMGASYAKNYLMASELLEKGLSNKDVFKYFYSNGVFETEMRLFLAYTLLRQSKNSEAENAVQSQCEKIDLEKLRWVDRPWIDRVCKLKP